MEFCSTCSTSLEPDDDRRIRCSGQHCKLVFHQRCVNLTEAHVRAWLDEDVGLFWFCPTCRVDLAPGTSSSQKHRIVEEDGERQRKKIRLDSGIRLPPEIWQMVFKNLESCWLARVRLVCRDFNELVCTRTELMDRFLLKLKKAQLIDDLDEVRHFLALSHGFTRAEIDFADVGKEKPKIEWFSILGETLTTLSCFSIPFGYLCQMLQKLPNLKRLTLFDCFEYGKKMKLNFKLEKLEQLTICRFYNKNYGESIFPALQHICPNIVDLRLHDSIPCHLNKQIGLFVFSIRESLQNISLYDSYELTKEMINLSNGLHLKQLSIVCSEHDLLRLLKRLPSLEHLHFRNRLTNVSIFEEIPRILPNLTTLKLDKVALAATSPPTPLNLTRAEFIRVRYETAPECVSGLSFCESSSLQRLEISGAYLPSDALASLAQVATRVKKVSFLNCRIKHASDILSFVHQSKSLDVLEIYWPTVASANDNPDRTNDRHSNLRHLRVKEKSSELLPALAEICPDLESLETTNLISEQEMNLMGQKLKRLKSLMVSWHEAARECLRQIPNGFEGLRNLQITRCRVTKEDMREALEGLRKDVEVAVDFWDPGWILAPPQREFEIL